MGLFTHFLYAVVQFSACAVLTFVLPTNVLVQHTTLHFHYSGAAVIFFFAYEANMLVLTCFAPLECAKFRLVNLLRQVCAVLTGILLAVFIFLSTDWGTYKLYIAICEW